MVVMNPFCPISFGFIGFLGAIVSRRTTLLQKPTREEEESGEIDILLVNKSDDEGDCDELSEDRITNFLELQKNLYYKSMGMDPVIARKPEQTSMNTSTTNSSTELTTPRESTIGFSSSRDTSYIEEVDREESSLLTFQTISTNVRTYAMNQSDIEDSDDENLFVKPPLLQPTAKVTDRASTEVKLEADSSDESADEIQNETEPIIYE